MASESLAQYLLLLLSDSNLPTGGFIASSGLESYIQHGLLSSDDSTTKTEGLLSFLTKSLHAYAQLNLPFVSSTHAAISALQASPSRFSLALALARITEQDDLFESMVLNHVARRASTAQGIALLTLYERAFADEVAEEGGAKALVKVLRLRIRKGEARGHLPVGFGVLTGALGLSLPAAQHLFLFLHARSILSSSIRLNTVGPYVAHRLLLHDVRPLVEQAMERCRGMTTVEPEVEEDERWMVEKEDVSGPATTWPLAEVLAARHDLLHSKIFNS